MNYTNGRTEEGSLTEGEREHCREKGQHVQTCGGIQDTFRELHSNHLQLLFDCNLEKEGMNLQRETGLDQFTKDCR